MPSSPSIRKESAGGGEGAAGTGGGHARLRPLNTPIPVRVRMDGDGRPTLLHGKERPRRVEAVREVWRIDDEWWRSPISREYVRVVLEDGGQMTLYRDLLTGEWYRQEG